MSSLHYDLDYQPGRSCHTLSKVVIMLVYLSNQQYANYDHCLHDLMILVHLHYDLDL